MLPADLSDDTTVQPTMSSTTSTTEVTTNPTLSPEAALFEAFKIRKKLGLKGLISPLATYMAWKGKIICSEEEADVCLQRIYDSLAFVCRGESGVCMQELEYGIIWTVANWPSVFWTTLPMSGTFRNIRIAQQPKPGFFALSAFFGVSFLATAILLILALYADFWTEKKPFLALLLVLMVACGLAVAYWALIGTGSQFFFVDFRVSSVKYFVVRIIGRVSSVLFLALFALFTWLLISAVFESFFPEKRKLAVLAAVVLAVILLGVCAYVVAVAVLTAPFEDPGPDDRFMIDASDPVIAGVLFLFSGVLALSWFVALRLVGRSKDEMTAMRRNATIFFSASAVLAAVFFTWFLIESLELGVDYFLFHDAARGLEVASLILTVFAVLGYVGMAVIGTSKNKDAKAGYVPLTSGESDVPARYADF